MADRSSPSIFFSYRRADVAGYAKLLHFLFTQWFDAEHLFYDAASIEAGQTFPRELANAVDGAAVVLVLIGPGWLAEINRRATLDEIDFVRREVEMALARHASKALAIIPVLLGGAESVSAAALHDSLRPTLAPLCAIDVHEFRGKDTDWNHQFERLRNFIAAVPNVPPPRWRPPPGTPRPFPTTLSRQRLSASFQDPEDRLARLHQALRQGNRGAVVAQAALYGMGGVGKTQLALQYVYRYRDHYAGVWWFDAESVEGLQLAARTCCEAVGAPADGFDRPTQALNAWLRRQGEPWLLVYDNADSLGSVRDQLPDAGAHHVVITSRDPAWGGIATVQARVWNAEQGADFLERRGASAGFAATRADRVALASALGGLPLALEQAASYLEATGMPLAEYTALVLDAQHASLVLDNARIATGYERSVMATLALAFDKLAPPARQLLRLLAWCAPEPVAERLFREGTARLESALAEAAGHAVKWHDTVGQLRRHGLVERVQVPALGAANTKGGVANEVEGALHLHRLTQEVARHRVSDWEQDPSMLLELICDLLPEGADSPSSWPIYAHLFPHVQFLDGEFKLTALDFERHAWLLHSVAMYLHVGPALYSSARELQERVLGARRQVLGEQHPDTLKSTGNLACMLRGQGNLAGARELQERVLEVHRRGLGEEHPDTLGSMNNLASTLWSQGDLAGARAIQGRVLELRRRVLGEEHPDTLNSMGNLAATLELQGDLAGARELQERVLEVRLRVLGGEHPVTLASMNNLAQTLQGQGDLSGAREFGERVFVAYRRVLGEEHPDTLKAMSNLASTLCHQGELAAARELQERVLESQSRVLGKEHLDTLGSMGNLANTLWSHGDPGARDLQEQVLEARRRVLGEEHPDTITSMNNLAGTLWSQGELVRARDLMERVFQAYCRVLGEEHADTLKSMGNLASILQSRGELERARDLQEQVLEAHRRVLGEEHPDTLTSMNNLAGTLGDQGDLVGARTLQERTLEMRRRVLGKEHPDTLTSMNNLAGTLWSQRELEGACKLQERVLEARRRVLGEDHPHTLLAARNLADMKAPLASADAAMRRLGRNEPCACGSGRKYKHCHGQLN